MPIARLVLIGSAALLAITAAAVARPAGVTTLRAGEADGANAVFVFDENVRAQAVVLRTARFGVAGSRIEVTVDQVKTPVFSHIFAPGECKFGGGGSVCEVRVSAKDPGYRAIVSRFRGGRLARVTVQDAGVMKMDQTLSLKGFANARR